MPGSVSRPGIPRRRPGTARRRLPSLGRVLVGLAIATAIAVPLGIALGRSPVAADYLNPLLQFARALPVVTMAPVFIVLFKIGTPMEVATIVFGTVWPILLNTIDGAASVDAVQLPKILTGFRLSLSLALILMIFSEFVGSSDGIGYEMVNASNSFDMTTLWSAIVLLGILGYLLNALLGGAERIMLSWHRGVRARS